MTVEAVALASTGRGSGPWQRFYEVLGQCNLWHLDETSLQVLKEPGRDNQQTSYLWDLCSGPPDPPMALQIALCSGTVNLAA